MRGLLNATGVLVRAVMAAVATFAAVAGSTIHGWLLNLSVLHSVAVAVIAGAVLAIWDAILVAIERAKG